MTTITKLTNSVRVDKSDGEYYIIPLGESNLKKDLFGNIFINWNLGYIAIDISDLTVNGEEFSGNESDFQTVFDENFSKANSSTGGTGIDLLDTYDNNTDAAAALGINKLYKSSTLINGSPIILITV